MLIAGDIGGTKTDLAIFANHSEPHTPLAQAQFHSAGFPSLQALVATFLAQVSLPVDTGCFAVAGPVVAGHAKATNLPWVMDERSIAADLKLVSVRLLNDLEAVARAVPVLRPSDFVTLSAGIPVPRAPIAIIAPGTGLGESFLTWDGTRYRAHGSEGGHSDFAPTDARQLRLLEYLLARFDHVGVERVCSGIGVPNLYRFLHEAEKIAESPSVARALESAPDRTRAILEAGLDPAGRSALCRATVDLLTAILASEAGNLVLKVLATGGIYFAGGIAFRLLKELEAPRFLQAFSSKGRFKDLMERIPVHVITTRAALMGAASYGLDHLKDNEETP
jgi:glucokinase